MYGLKNSFQKIKEEIQIPFKIIEKDGAVLADFLKGSNSKLISSILKIPSEELILQTYENYSNCISLLKYCLEQELCNAIKSKEEIIIDILKGKEFSDEILNEIIKYKPFKLILIYLKNKHKDAIKILKEKYVDEDSILVSQDEYMLIVNHNDVSEEEITNILNDLKNNISKNVFITYCKIDDYNYLKNKYEQLKRNLVVCVKYKLESKVYRENALILEKMINNFNDKEANGIYKEYNERFSKLDEDLIKTIEVFLSEGLRISESADKLFIHRNTLFYRIDKIKKLVNYDISNFNEATEFKILFLIWKSINKKNNN